MHRITRISALAFGIAGALAFGQVQASGFQLKENSVKAMGRAFAGSASAAGDASVVANNPAAMSTFKTKAFQADVTVVDLSAEFTGGGFAAAGTGLQQPLRGGNGGDPGDTTPIPAMSAIFPVGDTGMTLGAMISAPFGLKTEYDNGWIGRYTALESEVKTVDLTLAASFDFGSEVSFGLGLVYERAEATLSKAIDFGSSVCGINIALCVTPTPATAAFGPQKNDGSVRVEGDDTGIGWIVGMHVHPSDRIGIGISRRSEIDHDLEGNADFTVPSNVATLLGPTGQFVDTGARAPLTTPAVTTISLTYGITDNFSVLADVSQTDWSSLERVDIFFQNPRQATASEEFGWEDTVFTSIGAEWKLSDSFTLRGGYAQDQSPTKLETRTPRLPDADRQWLSFGLSWMPSESLEVNAGYTRIMTDDPEINVRPSTASSGSSLVGEFDANVNLFGLSAQYRF